MDGFINFLEEYKYDDQDEKTITEFKEKLNKPIIDYKQHLARYKCTEGWFSKLDDILIELGYKACDVDINYIKIELFKLIQNTHINHIINIFNKKYNKNIEKFNTSEVFRKITYVYSTYDFTEVVSILIKNSIKICWSLFFVNNNSSAVEYCIKSKKIWKSFSKNTADIAVKYLIEHPDKINWSCFSSNENYLAVNYLISTHPNKIDWKKFSRNKADLAVAYCIEHPDNIDWCWFSLNNADIAVKYCIKHPDKISWTDFSENSNNIAVDYLIYTRPDKIGFISFSKNENKNARQYIKINYPELTPKNDIKYCISNQEYIKGKIQIAVSQNTDNLTPDELYILYTKYLSFVMKKDAHCNHMNLKFKLLNIWKIYVICVLNWLPKSRLKLNYE